MNIDYAAIGRRIRNRRKKLGITQAVLAQKADLGHKKVELHMV